MPAKIRLTRQGRKNIPYYHIVVADSRAPRDGRYIERLGKYFPKTNPASVELNFDRALYWLQTGAEPTDTCRSILSEQGVLLKNHLLNGVKKKALTLEQVETKFSAWLAEKDKKLAAKKDLIKSEVDKAKKQRLEAESKVREAKAAAIAQKAMQKLEAQAEAQAEGEAQAEAEQA
ncbi:MAG TPA: 30S ribosomal protein S16 [Bacteroidales bacterium]|nr:30S ribosomal protein S16 [Bacteroidales bacterium]